MFLKVAKAGTKSIGVSNMDNVFGFKFAEHKTSIQLFDITVKLM